VYAGAAALPRAIGFLLLPAYTRALGPADYGTVSLLFSIGTAAGILFTLGLDTAVFRTYFALAADPERQRDFVASAWRLLVVLPVACAGVAGGLTWLTVDSGRFSGPAMLLSFESAAVNVAATTVPLAVLRADQRLRPYLLVTVTSALGTSGLTLLFVVGFDGGVVGWLGATVVANAIALVVAALVVPLHARRAFDVPLTAQSVRFGLPLLPHFLGHWALQLADRSVLAGLVTADALGVYSLAANLALPTMIVVQSLNQGFMPTYARVGAGRGAHRELEPVVLLQVTLVTFVCVTAALLAPPLVSVMAPAAYAEAGSLTAWIVLGYAFLGLYYVPMNGLSLGAGITKHVWIATVAAASTNIGLLFCLVPSGGLRAAAIASSVGYAVLLCGVYVYARRPGNPVVYRWGAIGLRVAVGLAVYAAAALATPDTGAWGLAVRCLVALGLAAALGLTDDRIRRRVLA
jgi:O-antigen/teichoic acid export membrane protein